MDFGKVSRVDHIRFELPLEDNRNIRMLKTNERSPRLGVYVGGPIWSCPQWVGKVYPRETPSKDYLYSYGRQFNSIELNSTFYGIPDPNQIQAWKNAVPEDFKFCPKLYQGISHTQDLSLAKANLNRFWDKMQVFEEKLGLCFLQLHPQLSFQSWGTLKQLLLELPYPKQLAIEFRHPSWFLKQSLRQEVYELLSFLSISTVITDVAGRRDVLHSSLTSRKVLVRFLGNELHPSDALRIDLWAARLTSWIHRGIEEIYFFVHQPTQAEVPELTKDLIDLLNARCHLNLRTWSPVQAAPSQSDAQLTFF